MKACDERKCPIWGILLSAAAIAANCIYVPLHLLAEAHLEARGLRTFPMALESPSGHAGDLDHPSPHEPHPAYEHRQEIVLVRPAETIAVNTALSAPVFAAPPEGTLSVASHRPEPFLEPRALPPPSPRQPRAPPRS
ncbi:MAG: hypothetical protein HY717_13300 [Planctomycetes bacterium]|nr:hypothetical protein [Planctomycetota bacterium]